MNENCNEYPLNLELINKEKLNKDMDTFCSTFKRNKLQEYQDAFLVLPPYVQCLFAYYCKMIFKRKNEGDSTITDKHIQIAIRLHNLFVKEKIKLRPEVVKIIDKFRVDRSMASKAREEIMASVKKEKEVFVKPYQKKSSLQISDPLFRFYNSLYEEKPNSKLAITWLTEHGAFEGPKREDLVIRYRNTK